MPQIPVTPIVFGKTGEDLAERQIGAEVRRKRLEKQGQTREYVENSKREIAQSDEFYDTINKRLDEDVLPGFPTQGKRSLEGEYRQGDSEPAIAPEEGDPRLFGAQPLGRSSLTPADIAGDPAPTGFGSGIGGPDQVLSEAEVVDLKERLAQRKASKLEAETRGRLLDSPVTPDQAAADLDLATKSGANRIEVEQDRETFKAADRAKEVDRVYQSAPLLRDWMSDRANFDIAHDDLSNLEWWEREGKILSAAAKSAWPTLVGGGASTLQAVTDQIDLFFRSPDPLIFRDRFTKEEVEYLRTHSNLPVKAKKEGDVLPQASKSLGATADTEFKKAAALTPTGMNDIEAGAYSGVQSMIANAPGIAVSAILKTPLPAVASGVTITTGQAYHDAREKGLDVNAAAQFAVTQGAVEYITEKIPMSHLFGDIAAKTPFIRTLTRNLIEENVGEQVATLLQDANEYATLHPEKTFQDYLNERPSAALQTAVAATVGSGVQTTLAEGVDQAARKFEQGAQQRRSENLSKTFDAMAKGAKDSRLLKRLPDKFREAVAAVTKDGPLESVRITPEGINELAQANNLTTDQLAQAFRIDPADMTSALASGEDVVIPAGNYAATLQTAQKELGISGEAIHTALAPNMRLRSDDFTAKEHEAMQKVFEQERQAREDQTGRTQEFADAADRVRETIREAVTGSKLFNAETANTQASIAGEMVVTLAERTGQDPEKLWKDMGFDVVTALTGEDEINALPQSAQRQALTPTDVEVFRASTELSASEFEAWKLAREGLGNEAIADRMADEEARNTASNRKEPGTITANFVATLLSRARDKGHDVAKAPTGALSPDTLKVIELKARDFKVRQIAERIYPDRDVEKAMGQIRVLTNRHKAQIEARRAELHGSLAQTRLREPQPLSDEELVRAAEALSPQQFEAFKAAREGLSASDTADRLSTEDSAVSVAHVAVLLSQARAKGFEIEKLQGGQGLSDETLRIIELRAKGLGNDAIAARLFPDRDPAKAKNLIAKQASLHKGLIAARRAVLQGHSAFAQGEMRGSYTPRADRSVIKLFESANLSTFIHESSHWYLDTLWRMAQAESPHPHVTSQLAAILEWHGKSAEWSNMFDAQGVVTAEGRDLHEAFAETFEAYLREGKAPSTNLRSVFASLKQWLMRIYKSISQIGRRVNINDEIRAVFDRALATDEAITAVHSVMERDGKAMAEAIIAKSGKDWTPERQEKFRERMAAKYAQAKEQAEAELMARLMDDYQRNQTAAWRDEERQVRREVQSEVDERPEQRAFAWLSGKGWRDTRADHVEDAAAEAEVMAALAQTAYDLNTPAARAEWVRTQTAQSKIPGETTDAKQWGFKLDDGTGVVVSIAPDPNGESVIEWTFLDRLRDFDRDMNEEGQSSISDLYKQGGPELSVSQLKQLLARVAAIVETDMRESERDAYTFTPATKAIGGINARLLKMIDRGPYEIIDFPGSDANSDVLVLHADARLANNGTITPRPENASRKLQWDDGERGEERQDDFYAEIEALSEPMGSSARGPAGTGDERTGTRPAELDYVVTDATDESLKGLRDRMIADNIVPVILLFRTTSGRVIAFPGDNGTSGFHHDLARQMLALGNLKLDHGVYNPRKWPTLAAMDAAGEHAWYATTGTAQDGETGRPARRNDEAGALGQLVGPKSTIANPEILNAAKELAAEGKSRAEIWKATAKLGQAWYQDTDGSWITETSDLGFGLASEREVAQAQQLLRHPSLFTQYPQLATMRTDTTPAESKEEQRKEGSLGWYKLSRSLPRFVAPRLTFIEKLLGKKPPTPPPGPTQLRISAKGKLTAEYTAIHETQHAIDDIEGRPFKNSGPYILRRHERRALNAEYRRLWTDAERLTVPPWVTEQEAVNWWLGGRADFASTAKFLKSGTLDPSPGKPPEQRYPYLDRWMNRTTKRGANDRDPYSNLDAMPGQVFLSNREFEANVEPRRGRQGARAAGLPKPEASNMVDLSLPLKDQNGEVRVGLEMLMDELGIEGFGVVTRDGQDFFRTMIGQDSPFAEMESDGVGGEETDIIMSAKLQGKSEQQMLADLREHYADIMGSEEDIDASHLLKWGKRLWAEMMVNKEATSGQEVLNTIISKLQAQQPGHRNVGGISDGPDVWRGVFAHLKDFGIVGAYFAPAGMQRTFTSPSDPLKAERETLQAEISELINEQERIKASGGSGFPAKKARNAEIERQIGTLLRDKIEIDNRIDKMWEEGRDALQRTKGDIGKSLIVFDADAPMQPVRYDGMIYSLTPEQAAMDAVRLEETAALKQPGDGAGRTSPPSTLPPMRLNLEAIRETYGEEALSALPPEVRAYSAATTDADQFVEIARDVRKTLNAKAPKSLWKFLSTRRTIGSGNDKIAYSGIQDPHGELISIIGQKKEAPGLIADPEKGGKRSRSYSIHSAAVAAWEEGYTDRVLDDAEFIDALNGDVNGAAPIYSRDDLATVQARRDAERWEQWFEENGVDISAPSAELRAKLETVLTGEAENAIGPDEAATYFGMPDGNALLQGLKEGPKRNAIIKNLTEMRMIAQHGDPFKDGTIAQEAEVYARNEVQQRQLEIELEALAKAAGVQFAGNLAKTTAQENLRSKQVREVLNYDQWRRLENNWRRKAVEAATKGKFDEATEFQRFALINSYMFTEGRKLAEKIEKTRKHLLEYEKKTKVARLMAAGPEYADQMAGLLSDYQLRPESARKEGNRNNRAVWIRAQMAGLDPYASYQDNTKSPAEQMAEAQEALERSEVLARLAEGTEAINYKSLPTAEFLAVKDEADLIWKLATKKDQLLKAGERKRLTLAAEDIKAEIETNQPNPKPPEPRESDAPGEKLKRSGLKYFAMHRTLQSLALQFAGGKDGGVFWRHIVRSLNEAYAHLATLRKKMGKEMEDLFSVYSKAERNKFFNDRKHFASIGESLTKQGRLAVALNWGNEKNRKRLLDSTGWTEANIREILDTLDKRDWDFVQSTWAYLDTWFPEANRVHEAVHNAPMDKVAPLQIATRFGIYAGGYMPIAFDPNLSTKSGQRQLEAEAKSATGRVGVRSSPGYSKRRVEGRVTLPLRLSVFDVIARHLDQVATSIATEEALYDVGRLVMHPEVQSAIIERHGRQIYNTIVNTIVTTKFGLEGASGVLAHLRNGATVVGLGWKVATALLQPVGVTNSIVRVGGYWMAKGYAAMGTDAVTIKRRASWATERSEFMRNRRQAQSPELAALKESMGQKSVTPRWITNSMFALMTNVQFYSVDVPTWYGGFYKAQAAGFDEGDSVAQADQAVIDAQGGGELHQTAAIQTGAGTKYASALRLLTNFLSYMITTYNLSMQRVRNTKGPVQAAALTLDLILMLSVPVAAKMMLDAWTKGGGGDDDDDPLWEKYGREQVAFLMSPFVGLSQVAGAVRGDDAFGYRGPAGLGIFAEGTNTIKAAAEADFDESFWRPANKTAGMIFHYPASQLDLTVRGAQALWDGESTNPAVLFFGPPPSK